MSALLAGHLVHLVMLGAPLLFAGGMALALRLTDPARPSRRPPVARGHAVSGAAACWAGAALVHAAVAPEHFREGTLLGWFFAMLAAGQLFYAWRLLRGPSPLLLAAGPAAAGSLVALWAYSRLVAIPFGLGAREPVGWADLLAGALELVAAGLSVRLLHATRTPAVAGMVPGRGPRPARALQPSASANWSL